MKNKNNQNPLELMAQLESVVVNVEKVSEDENLEGLKSGREKYFGILKRCFQMPRRNIGGSAYEKAAEKLSELDDRFSKAVKPYLMQIYFPQCCGGKNNKNVIHKTT